MSVVVHGSVLAALMLGTLRPHRMADAAGVSIVIAWPQTPEGGSSPLDPGPAPVPPIVAVPTQPPIVLPPIDPGLRFDAGPLLAKRAAPVVGLGDGAEGDAWSAATVEDPPRLLAGPPPAYQEALRRAGIGGRVVVQAVIDTLGRVEPGSVVVESSVAGLEAPARAYALGALFRPGRVNGHAVRVLVRLPIDFTLAPGR